MRGRGRSCPFKNTEFPSFLRGWIIPALMQLFICPVSSWWESSLLKQPQWQIRDLCLKWKIHEERLGIGHSDSRQVAGSGDTARRSKSQMEIFSPFLRLPSCSPSVFSEAPFSAVPGHTTSISSEPVGQHHQCPRCQGIQEEGYRSFPRPDTTSNLHKVCLVIRASWHSPDHLEPPILDDPQTGYYFPWEDPLTDYFLSQFHVLRIWPKFIWLVSHNHNLGRLRSPVTMLG